MVRINQTGLKSFVFYVSSFILLTLFIYLGIPFFFDYKNNQSDLERKIFENFDLNLSITSRVKYNIFPSPRLNLKDVEILGFSESSKNIGSVKKVILKIPFKRLVSLKKLDFDSIELIDAAINIKISEINNFKKYLNNRVREKPIQLTKSKINLLNKTKLFFNIDIKKLRISGKNLFNKLDLKGRIFDTKIEINYQNKNFNKNSEKNVEIWFPEIGLNSKLSINPDKKNNETIYGRVSVFFPSNQIYLDYILRNKIFNISSSRLTNNYFKGRLFGDLILFPFSTFDLKLDIDLLKFKNILNSRFINNNKFLSQLIPINKKINGNIIINVDKVASTSNIINSGNANLEFKNSVLIVKEINLIINKIGNIKFAGKIFQQKKKKVFIFNTKINLDNPEIFYSRFLIQKKNRIDLAPINLLGKINLESNEVKLDKIYLENALNQEELDEDKLFFIQERINEIFSQSSLNNIFKYSNLRKIIQSFFN
ncbi:MAG: hypothetical protein CMI70_04170 [Candidatus Pelagibacter sp.]|jgi:hypothetical protein|nr:hypothetical protein [Candidatus Pelagibacter sp.]MDP6440618.1 hypothetical protein [Pelagibacteraceae bacterium]|tara:strand:- start:4584 stop:6029 length:1446 start_codon:yes stop_codon:yes gene_type:complete